MLKVVGASWQKTRIGTYILIGAGLLVIGAFFMSYIERPTYNGTYCATAFWNQKVGFQIEYWKQQNDLLNIPKGAARICYKDSIYDNGWAQIEVETQRTYPDSVQAYGAGILEGSLTWNSIYNQWENTIQTICDRDENAQNFCTWLRDLLEQNFITIRETVKEHSDRDHYWHHIGLFFNQLEGLETGYRRGAKRARSDLEDEIPFVDFLLMNSVADIRDLLIYYENIILNKTDIATDAMQQLSQQFELPSATMLTKILKMPNSPVLQLLFGHSTAGSYFSMLRIQKRYKFHYHFNSNQRTNTVPGVDITFTGYPGILGSTDDFYIVKGRQVQTIVGGVALRNENLELWRNVNIQQGVPLVARVMAANRISQSRRTWARAMARHPFTGTKQWITVDLNKLGPQDNLYNELSVDANHDDAPVALNAADEAAISERHNQQKNLVWIIEQLPGHLHYKDVSENFINNATSTWFANGLPNLPESISQSGVFIENVQYHLSSAANEKIINLEAVDQFLRTQGFFGKLPTAQSTIQGTIDVKLFSYNARIGVSDYHALAGPIFIRLQHSQNWQAETSGQNVVNSEKDVSIIASAVMDERLSISVDDNAEMAELEMITERRPVRNDMKAIAMARNANSNKNTVEDKVADGSENANSILGKFSPTWAW